MTRKEPILFKKYPGLKEKVPWMPILTGIPTPVDRLTELEKHLKVSSEGHIYIKRDDKNHNVYGGNKLRKFEFIFADAQIKKKKGMMTFGGVGTNHGLACAIVAKDLGMKCDLFLTIQPLTWHVQRSLLLFDYYGAKLHYAKGYGKLALKGLLFRLFHPKYFLMLPGGSTLLGKGTPLGTIGYINALFELKEQIDNQEIPEPEAIFVAGGSTGTCAGLIAAIKVLGLSMQVYVVAVSDEMFVNPKSITKNSNKALKYLQKRDPSFPKTLVEEGDFEVWSEYLGSEYGVKTVRGQKAVDLISKLDGKRLGFKLETTYTGKAMAGMLDYLGKEENKSKKVLFWNTYNSNDLDETLRKTNFNWEQLPKAYHEFYKTKLFQCWQIANCDIEVRDKCPAFLNHEYRFWKILDCSQDEETKIKIQEEIEKAIPLEDA